MRNVFLFFLIAFSFSYSQAPGWLSRPALPSSASAPSSSSEKPKVVYRTKVETRVDTVRVFDTVRTVRVDTIRDTVPVPVLPLQYKYVIRYALAAVNIELNKSKKLGSGFDWSDHASVSEIFARDSATLRVGVEEIRTLGHIIDQFGNRIPQQEVITTGFTINVLGDRAVIEYRGSKSVALFSGNFVDGYLLASAEIEDSGIVAEIFPFNLFFGTNRKRVIIEIVREFI